MTRLGRTQFLAALSHELRTPLNSILGFTQVLLSELDGPITAAQREDLEAIASAGTYLATLVREVLDTSAEETSELELFGRLDLRAIASDAARLFEPQARKSSMELVVLCEGPLPRPLGAARAVRQVLLNLIGNAVKHGSPGAIRIDAHARGEIAVLSVTNVGRAVLGASDAPFGAFERGATTSARSEPTEGWGLGLAIANELAARMAGTIEMRSDLSSGRPETTFALLLPLGEGRLGPVPSDHAMPTRAHFVAAMSHELRAPLGSIAGFAGLLEDGLEGPLTPAQRQSVSSIRRSAESLVASLTDILDVAKADVGRISLVRGATTARAVLDDILEGAARLVELREPPCTLVCDPAEATEIGVIHVDARRLVQATVGLVRHALRTGTPEALEVSARESTSREPRMLRIEVRDPARRSDPREAESAFDPFAELLDPSGRRIFGMGLTLALARTLARMHGGDAWCETSRGTAWILAVPT